MTVSQSDFRAALLDATLPVPAGLLDKNEAPAGARFSVYRNNVVLSLTEALETAFPLVRKLLGAETFARLAGLYVRAHPPCSPLMMFYGEALPDFLAEFEPLKHIGYLPDCARLDLAQRQSYHAADSSAFDPAPLMAADAEAAHITLAPATRILRSDWPLFDIWRYNMQPDTPKPQPVAQDVLITRPEFDPQVHLLPAGAATWLEALATGQTLGAAVEAATAAHPEFDLTATLGLALGAAAFTDDKTKDCA